MEGPFGMATPSMTSMNEMRRSGISVVGDRPWGTHFCNFYESRKDLLGMLVSYFKAGLEDNEFCVWVLSEPLSEKDAWEGLREAVPEFDDYASRRSIEVFDGRDWYLKGGAFDSSRVMTAWNEKIDRAMDRGYAGLRGTGNTAWLQNKDWKAFSDYEQLVNDSVVGRRAVLLCTYALQSCGATELLDVVGTHQFAMAMRHGNLELIETPELKVAKAEIKKMNDELESRVHQRTQELEAANGKLAQAQAELAHINRVVTIGELTASIAHEIKQPLAAIVGNAKAGVRLLDRPSPDTEEVKHALADIAEQGDRAAEIISRISAQMKSVKTEKTAVDINETVREVIALAHRELENHGVSVRMELASTLAPVTGDRVQLQQVILNLIMNGVEAMDLVASHPKALLIESESDRSEVFVSVRDSGMGVDAENGKRIFEAFFTTKPQGMGMGLAISRSIIEEHGGQLTFSPNSDQGTTFRFTLPSTA
jgi:C4-dicarboxylate-specific signal transduction histidine kinase